MASVPADRGKQLHKLSRVLLKSTSWRILEYVSIWRALWLWQWQIPIAGHWEMVLSCGNTGLCDSHTAEYMPIDFSLLRRKCPFDALWLQNWKAQLLFRFVLNWFDLIFQKKKWSIDSTEVDSCHTKCDIPVSYLAFKTMGILARVIHAFRGGFTRFSTPPPNFRGTKITTS